MVSIWICRGVKTTTNIILLSHLFIHEISWSSHAAFWLFLAVYVYPRKGGALVYGLANRCRSTLGSGGGGRDSKAEIGLLFPYV